MFIVAPFRERGAGREEMGNSPRGDLMGGTRSIRTFLRRAREPGLSYPKTENGSNLLELTSGTADKKGDRPSRPRQKGRLDHSEHAGGRRNILILI